MSQPPPGQPGYAQVRIPQPPPQVPGYRVPPAPAAPHLVAPHHDAVPTERYDTAPTLLQFWRSDSRVVPGRRPARWAGRLAFWVGLVAAVLYIAGRVAVSLVLVWLAAPFAVVALVFALIAVVAGIGRGPGIFGLIFAVLGSHLFWVWAESTFA